MNFDEERALAAVAHEAIVETRRRRRWQIFFRFIWMGYFLLLLLIMLNVGGDRDSTSSSPGSKHIAVVPIQGLIAADSDANADDTIRSLEKAFKNPHTEAVFLDINSGGGSPVQSGEIYRAVMRLKAERKLPVYAVIADAGASGAYFIAASADEIYADPASIVGSIGVISQNFGYRELLGKLGLDPRTFTAGEHKNFLAGDQPLKPEEVAHMQGLLDNIHQQFIKAVRDGRGSRLKETPEMFSGLFWTGEQALPLGLIDALGDKNTLRDAKYKDLKMIEYKRDRNALERLLRDVGSETSASLRRALDFSEQVNPMQFK
ncbi:signal peptide peptidase SppA [Cardiobacterium valvarum]|uniref:Signal peptide peptidase SppA n=1 Tax=Cardiobacterium valvarum F0432 TaxID=797473 RepID=G9ZC98_9GAMM|nr:signal peptide peptidase SppA [Cardiobacterium valvarum]EHM55832.1 signal peptide peptidase SppA [Cardiobacterium valvarum F0432]